MEEILGLVRTLAGIGAGALATKGVIDQSDTQLIVAAAVAIATAVWSIYNKRQHKAAVAVAVMTTPPKPTDGESHA